MEHEAIKQLLKRYLAGECTPEERIRVEQWYQELDIHPTGFSKAEMENDIAEIRKRLPLPAGRRATAWYRYAAAAVVVIAAMIGAHFYFSGGDRLRIHTNNTAASRAEDIAPGGNRAILELADGTEIVLDDRPDGEIAREGDHAVYKNTDGELVYRLADDGDAGDGLSSFNTVRTPRGGQYHLILPDGTKVWLNAESTLTYAVSRSAKERLVKLEGEAYFEVSKDADRLFRVESAGQVVEVMGTHFNINSYPDEPAVRTTLLEGSVRVMETTRYQKVILNPGEQSVLNGSGRLSVSLANTGEAIAWKNGKFSFSHSDIGTIMRQLSRWYDVEIVYEGKIPTISLTGEMYRNTHASKVLEILSFYNLNCRIETVGGIKRIVVQ